MNELQPINFSSLPALTPEQTRLAETIIIQQVERERNQTNFTLNQIREREFNRTERLESWLIFAGACVLVIFTFLALREESRLRENNQIIELIKIMKDSGK